MKQVYCKYVVVGGYDTDEYHDEIAFRKNILGPNHWSGMSHINDQREITVRVTEEQAILFKLRFPNCQIKPYVPDVSVLYRHTTKDQLC